MPPLPARVYQERPQGHLEVAQHETNVVSECPSGHERERVGHARTLGCSARYFPVPLVSGLRSTLHPPTARTGGDGPWRLKNPRFRLILCRPPLRPREAAPAWAMGKGTKNGAI